jgi:hypothetical protein
MDSRIIIGGQAMSEENRNALRCGYESETGKRHWENPVCHGEIAYASHAYQLFLEDLVISCEEELRRAHEEHDKLCDSLALVNEKDARITEQARLLSDAEEHLKLKEKILLAYVAELQKWKDASEKVLSEKCAPDEQHCSCVPFLRLYIEQQKNKGMLDCDNLRAAWKQEVDRLKAGERELLVDFVKHWLPDLPFDNDKLREVAGNFLVSRNQKEGK